MGAAESRRPPSGSSHGHGSPALLSAYFCALDQENIVDKHFVYPDALISAIHVGTEVLNSFESFIQSLNNVVGRSSESFFRLEPSAFVL